MSQLRRICLFIVMAPAMLSGATYVFNPEASSLRIYVPKAGLLSFAGHDHMIEATEFSGSLQLKQGNWSEAVLKVTFAASSLRVMDHELPEEDRQKVARQMKSDEVLGVQRFPQIVFTSEAMEKSGPATIKVEGRVTIRETAAPVSFQAKVKMANSTSLVATGSVTLRLADFGIEPVKALGGMIQTGKEIEVTFEFIGTNRKHS